MPAASSNELPKTSMTGTVEIASAQWGEMTVAFEKLSPQDFGPNPCPNYHWGFLFTGKMVVRYADREETIEAGQAFHMEPGHLQKVLEACEEWCSPRRRICASCWMSSVATLRRCNRQAN